MILNLIKSVLLYMLYFVLGLLWIIGASYLMLGEYEKGYVSLAIVAILTGFVVWRRSR